MPLDLSAPTIPMPTKGVQMVAPPATMLPSIMGSINAAVAQLPKDANGAFVALATETGAHGAVVVKLENNWTVTAWAGKNWGSTPPTLGAEVMHTW